ncbi:hypothetical protein HK405_006177, partial [Cladochytrium tenue]
MTGGTAAPAAAAALPDTTAATVLGGSLRLPAPAAPTVPGVAQSGSATAASLLPVQKHHPYIHPADPSTLIHATTATAAVTASPPPSPSLSKPPPVISPSSDDEPADIAGIRPQPAPAGTISPQRLYLGVTPAATAPASPAAVIVTIPPRLRQQRHHSESTFVPPESGSDRPIRSSVSHEQDEDNFPDPAAGGIGAEDGGGCDDDDDLGPPAEPHPLPDYLFLAIDRFEELAKQIASYRALDEQIPTQSRLISNLRNRLELDKKELGRRETERRRLGAELDGLHNSFSLSKIVASFQGGVDRRVAEIKTALDAARKAEANVRSQVNVTHLQLGEAIETIEKMTDRNKLLSQWRKELITHLDQAVDELDRHVAAEAEMRSALQLVQSAMALLSFLCGKEGEIPDWFASKLVY